MCIDRFEIVKKRGVANVVPAVCRQQMASNLYEQYAAVQEGAKRLEQGRKAEGSRVEGRSPTRKQPDRIAARGALRNYGSGSGGARGRPFRPQRQRREEARAAQQMEKAAIGNVISAPREADASINL